MDHLDIPEVVTTYEEAAEVVARMGMLPLAPLIPQHPSLNGLTKPENWHTGTELDPWSWRARFPGDGLAGYGKFMKKKALLVSKAWFPAYVAAAGSLRSLEERYDSGLCSKEALILLQIIRANEGIETRRLRTEAGMKAPEQKRSFDNAVIELQGSLDIVISGVKQRVNELGEASGWNSTSFETTGHWMEASGISPFAGERGEAITWLHEQMAAAGWSPAAAAWIDKALSW
ncbi:AlkZ-related protein [Paenibacillus donghaensis]|uniref:Uncharacterized protein n=1 Tax=Paenibacillus donghaensis TaxID=414771 RepID=A0A2Z2K8P7_9BACL|nr:hypothetical protein [Paenibacillus donghaensis]ASA21724.1 hypothetical protein B9T62_13660 [Paenibacillus donghaensis]